MLSRPGPLILLSVSCVLSKPALESFGPSLEAARQNAPQIFNAVHNAMRQFGSSLHHNGMSFFPAIVPPGTLLYHGEGIPEIPTDLEWLAFDIEHAENFAKRRIDPSASRLQSDAHQKPMVPSNEIDDSQTEFPGRVHGSGGHRRPRPPLPGYLHIYQAVRPLNLLYIDGMAAGKTDLGTNDAEDYILSANKSRLGYDDMRRAADLCRIAKEWRIDGVIRMEPGFEVIYCDFHDGGLRQVSATLRPEREYQKEFDDFEWLQAASKRYHGIGGGRVLLDYSAMVSAFFYPVNLTNPEITRAEQPRLINVPEVELAAIKQHVDRVLARARTTPLSTIDWQGVTDMVVTRFVDRLSFMLVADSLTTMRLLVAHMLDIYIDYSEPERGYGDALERCAQHYIQHIIPTTPEDEFIYAGIEGTTTRICHVLFRVREIVGTDSQDEEGLLKDAVAVVQQLTDQLLWSEWKECGPCKTDEVCYIAMWPYGNVEDHYTPSCLNVSASFGRFTYWEGHWQGPD